MFDQTAPAMRVFRLVMMTVMIAAMMVDRIGICVVERGIFAQMIDRATQYREHMSLTSSQQYSMLCQ